MTSSSLTEPLLRLDGLCYAYPRGDGSVLDHLDLTLEKSERIAIMGRSGAGKSTLLNVLALLQEAQGGVFLFNNTDISRETSNQRARIRAAWIGMVFQAYYLIPYLTVRENVALALELQPEPMALDRIDFLIEAVGLAHRRTYRPTQLSGGEQQRVGLARALVKSPKLLLADEPTGNLDEETGDRILDVLLKSEIYAGAVITVTHQKTVAARFDRTLDLKQGRLHERAPESVEKVKP